MPDASTHPQPRMQMKRAYELVTTGSPKRFRHSLREWFYGFLRALPGEPGFLATIVLRIIPTRLDASVGASEPHDFAVR